MLSWWLRLRWVPEKWKLTWQWLALDTLSLLSFCKGWTQEPCKIATWCFKVVLMLVVGWLCILEHKAETQTSQLHCKGFKSCKCTCSPFLIFCLSCSDSHPAQVLCAHLPWQERCRGSHCCYQHQKLTAHNCLKYGTFWCSFDALLAFLMVQQLWTKLELLCWERNVTTHSTGWKLIWSICEAELGTEVWPEEWIIRTHCLVLYEKKHMLWAGQGCCGALGAGSGVVSFIQSLLRERELNLHCVNVNTQ